MATSFLSTLDFDAGKVSMADPKAIAKVRHALEWRHPAILAFNAS
jgi:hypothetical protein